MTYSQLIDIVRTDLEDNIEPYLWSEAELLLYIQKALDLFLTSTEFYKKSRTGVAVTAGTSDIALQEDEIGVSRLWVDGKEIYVAPNQRELNAIRYWGVSGTPQYFTVVDRKVMLYPIPDNDITVDYEAICTVTQITNLEAQIPVPLNYAMYLIEGVKAYAYLKSDSETYEPQEAQRHMSLFMAEINRIKNDNLRTNQIPDTNTMPRGFL